MKLNIFSLLGNGVWLNAHRYLYRADSRFASSKWESTLQSNAVSHWLGANLESTLFIDFPSLFVFYDTMMYWCWRRFPITLRSPERHVVSNHRQIKCSFNSVFMLTTKTIKALVYQPILRGIQRYHKKPVMWNVCPCHGVINYVFVFMSLLWVCKYYQNPIYLRS